MSVRDAKGDPVPDAVVVAVPAAGSPKPKPKAARDVVDQIDREFVPAVKVVQTGTAVVFPNKDNIRHHVYSFSSAKTFELPLYRGTPAEPVVFDRPGLVILGCNIHDWMLAHVYVVDSPWFATTGTDGGARILDLPPGDYEVETYHPRAKDPAQPLRQRVAVGSEPVHPLSVQLTLKPSIRNSRPPKAGGAGYP